MAPGAALPLLTGALRAIALGRVNAGRSMFFGGGPPLPERTPGLATSLTPVVRPLPCFPSPAGPGGCPALRADATHISLLRLFIPGR